ncbi:MAG: SLATT domain-containing protein [Halomonas sp.]|nr:SLATT domain-containing protein [Halomonas sp.]MBL1267465.1 SLATT domain-containing protein [Halomonas sp.]
MILKAEVIVKINCLKNKILEILMGSAEKKDPLDDLYRKIDITAETRFHASRRLMLHSDLSLKVNVFISLFLILTTLLQLINLGVTINSDFVIVFQVVGAMAIIIFSIFSNFKNYSGVAEKFYSCASELVELKRKVLNQIHEKTAVYDEIANEYSAILKRYETHTVKDFRSDHTRALAESKHAKDKGFLKKIKCHFKWVLGYFLDFISYILVLFSLGPLLVFILFGTQGFSFSFYVGLLGANN